MSRIEDLEKRLAADPNSKIFVQLAEEYRKAGLQEDAIATCREGLEKHPNYFSARVALGRALLETDGLEEARAEFETVLQQVPDNLLALKFLGETLHKLGRLDEALSKYELASTLSPEDSDLVERMQQVQAAAAAKHAGAGASTPPGDQSLPPTIPPANLASRFVERQAREMTSDQVSDDVLSMQEEFEDQPVTSIFKRTARELQDLGSMPPPGATATPGKPDAPGPGVTPPSATPEATDDTAEAPIPRETAVIDLGGAKITKPFSGTSGPPMPAREDAKSAAPGAEPMEPVRPARPDTPAEPVPFGAPSGASPAIPAQGEAPRSEDALPDTSAEEDAPGLATTTLAELYVSQGHLDRAVNVYRQLVASHPDDRELQTRLEELELLVLASQAPDGASARVSRSRRATSPAPSTDPKVPFLEQAIRELEGWLTAIGKS